MLPRIVSGLAENTNSIFCDGPRARYSEWMSGSATAGTIAERHTCELVLPWHRYCALLKKRASGDVCFLLTNLPGRWPLVGSLPFAGGIEAHVLDRAESQRHPHPPLLPSQQPL